MHDLDYAAAAIIIGVVWLLGLLTGLLRVMFQT
jgi:hypothetical protein